MPSGMLPSAGRRKCGMGSPAFSDERQQDVAAVRAALDGVAAGKMAELPVMSSAELCALGALSHPVLDASALAWWNSQADKTSQELKCQAATED
jgi:hypothetical protein